MNSDQLRNVTRVEVINHANEKGRVYSIQNPDIRVELSLQDDGRTLKVFIDSRQKIGPAWLRAPLPKDHSK